MDLTTILAGRGLSLVEYAVLWHVRDTVVIGACNLAGYVARHPPNFVTTSITDEDCDRGIASLLARGLLIELTPADIESDLARWRAEPLPVSWGVDRHREPGDVDLTQAGFREYEEIVQLETPQFRPLTHYGYNDETPGLIRVFGDSEDSCRRQLEDILARIDDWKWAPGSARVEPMREIGPWWHSRYEVVPIGFEIVIRRAG